MLSCSLQDAGGGGGGHERAVAGGFALLLGDDPSSTAVDSRDAPPATASGFPSPLGDTRSPSPACCGDNPCGDDVDNPADRKPVAGDGKQKAETQFGSMDIGGSLSRRLPRM